MSRHENLNKKRKKWHYVYRNFRITRTFKTPKTPKAEIRLEWWKWKKLHMERRYKGSQILLLESRAQSMSLQICLALLPFIVDLTFGKIWVYIYGKSHRYLPNKVAKNKNSLAHVQKIAFLQISRWLPFKTYLANDLEETIYHPN